jgi:hypothetical protein
MRVAPVLRTFVYAVELFVLGVSGAYAQLEIDPDHFDSPNTEPTTKTLGLATNPVRTHMRGDLGCHTRQSAAREVCLQANTSFYFRSDGLAKS